MAGRDPLLQSMLDDMEEAPELYRPTSFWETGLPQLIHELDEKGIGTFRRHDHALNFFVPNFGDAAWFRRRSEIERVMGELESLGLGIEQVWRDFMNGSQAAMSDYRAFRASDDPRKPPRLETVCESAFGAPLEQFDFDDQRVSRSMLNYLRMLTMLKRHVDTGPIARALEIGGGYGSLGEILLKAPDGDYFYVDVDIPPVGFVATRYLQEVFGKHAVASYDQTREMERICVDELAARYRCAVLCPWQLPRLEGRFELFVNSISFQEMEPHVVRNYAEHVERLVDPYVLMRNSRSGKPLDKGDGVPGTRERVTRDTYLETFSAFDLVEVEGFVHGQVLPTGFISEVMLLRRRRGVGA